MIGVTRKAETSPPGILRATDSESRPRPTILAPALRSVCASGNGRRESDGSGRPGASHAQGRLGMSAAIALPVEGVVEAAPRAVVAARELSRRYGDGEAAVEALRDVSLDVA